MHNFTRGYGPRHFDFNSHGDVFIIGEMTPTLIKMSWSDDADVLIEKGRIVLETDLAKWSGAEIHINRKDEIFVSLRDMEG